MGTHNVITIGEEKVSDGGYAGNDQAVERERTWTRLEEVAEQERFNVIRLFSNYKLPPRHFLLELADISGMTLRYWC